MNITISAFSPKHGYKLGVADIWSSDESSSDEEWSLEDEPLQPICITNNPAQWELMFPSHDNYNRNIYISLPRTEHRTVAKLEVAPMRAHRLPLVLPHAEEIAYKICKMFRWNTIPKTKVIHQYSVTGKNLPAKLQKYAKLASGFNSRNHPFTITFQAFVEGESIPWLKYPKNLNLSSYQKAYLLGMVLGKYDARCDNVILNLGTRELFEIDNEYIGMRQYQDGGFLNNYKSMKTEEISPEILETILSVSNDQLTKIQDKYTARDNNLIAHWAHESYPIFYGYMNYVRKDCWNTIERNFNSLKFSIHDLRDCKMPVTIENLESTISFLYQYQYYYHTK